MRHNRIQKVNSYREKTESHEAETRAVARVPLGNWAHSLPATTPLADAAAGTPEVVFLPCLAGLNFQRALFIHEPDGPRAMRLAQIVPLANTKVRDTLNFLLLA
jgi:hypothetical protein